MRMYKTTVIIPANHPLNKDEVEYRGEFFFEMEEYMAFCDLCSAEGITGVIATPIYSRKASEAFQRMIKNIS